jgi:putative oxidoreductase
MAEATTTISRGLEAASVPKPALVFLGRLFYVLLFLTAAPNHFTKQGISYAVAQGVPLASIGVPLTGVIALVASFSILLGYRARIGAWLMVLFLALVTPLVHKFWGVADPNMAQQQMFHFFKNVSMLGGALLITQFGAGSWSLDARRSR